MDKIWNVYNTNLSFLCIPSLRSLLQSFFDNLETMNEDDHIDETVLSRNNGILHVVPVRNSFGLRQHGGKMYNVSA